jgi:pseudouridine-5'-phosphate glycosidase
LEVPLTLAVRPDVAAAVAAGRPVVALESSLITHGLPRPMNLEVARTAEAEVRASGALPATVALRDGCIVVGLSEDELTELAQVIEIPARKATRQNLAAALVEGGWWGTTVSATMIAARAAGIRVFATGGIGGVHRGAERSFDVSADLEELARTPVAVVCAGPKAILDAPATLEYLETRGVPVIGLGTMELPGFWSRESGVPVPITARDEREAAAVVAQHWSLGLGSGVLVAVPIPEADALPRTESEAAVARALDEAETAGRSGPETTPWLLARVAELTRGRSLAANSALIVHNACVAARLAIALAAVEPARGGESP